MEGPGGGSRGCENPHRWENLSNCKFPRRFSHGIILSSTKVRYKDRTAEETGTVNALKLRVRAGLLILIALMTALGAVRPAAAAPFAAYVMDGRSGQTLYSQNGDTPLHPASLTKMMTLYLAFAAIEQGRVRLDSRFTVSNHAASMPPSRLGLRPGQQIELRYLIRAAAVKSANDAATVIGEGLAGSEPQFAAQMTAMARALGMRNSQFRNANGLSVDGHYSSAHDLTILGRHLFYDFPQYYSIFSRRSADAGVALVSSTNARFLDSYAGADGIKTGYTRAAGFNLTASAQRGSKRIMATVMGGSSTAQRNQIMAQLLDAGFSNSSANVAVVKPQTVIVQPERVRRATVVAAAPVVAPSSPVEVPAGARGTRTERPRVASVAALPARSAAAAAAPVRRSKNTVVSSGVVDGDERPSPGAVNVKAALREAMDSRPARRAAADAPAKPAKSAARSSKPAAKVVAKSAAKTGTGLRPLAKPEGSSP